MLQKKSPLLLSGAAFLVLLSFTACGSGTEIAQGNASTNGAPNGIITEPAASVTIHPGQSVTFSGTATDPDSNPVTVLWNFGDGTTSTLLAPGDHTYATEGTFTVTLTAT